MNGSGEFVENMRLEIKEHNEPLTSVAVAQPLFFKNKLQKVSILTSFKAF
jgi:hypothetical protein